MASSIPQTECLTLAVKSTPTENKIDIYITLQFQEGCKNILAGQIKYALLGGSLDLQLENATFIPAFSSQTVPILTDNSTPTGECFINRETETTYQLTLNRPIFQGKLNELKIGHLEITNFPATITISFNIAPTQIKITGTEKIWPHDITPNKHAILETAIARYLPQNHLLPLTKNQIIIKYSSPQQIEQNSNLIESTPNTEIQPLEDIIKKVTEAQSDNFLSLAKIANLDYRSDLLRANLVGVCLEAIDLSNANLTGINLRGALLNDVDFSGANLSEANLAGADLSGALLSDANLQGADLHKASLALANLAGANCTGANFTGANLNNTNLSDADLTQANLTDADLKDAGLVLTKLAGIELTGANIQGARFRHDSGLSPEMQQDLIQRGAILEP